MSANRYAIFCLHEIPDSGVVGWPELEFEVLNKKNWARLRSSGTKIFSICNTTEVSWNWNSSLSRDATSRGQPPILHLHHASASSLSSHFIGFRQHSIKPNTWGDSQNVLYIMLRREGTRARDLMLAVGERILIDDLSEFFVWLKHANFWSSKVSYKLYPSELANRMFTNPISRVQLIYAHQLFK